MDAIGSKSMKTNDSFSFTPRLILGLGIIALGVLFLLDNFNIASARTILYYWPALLIIVGAAHFFQHRTLVGSTWSLFLIFIGGGMLLDRIYDIEFNFWSFWPVILVFLGASMITQSMGRRRIETGSVNPNDDSTIKTSAIMGGVKKNIASKDFQGGEMTAIMGGIDLDLREAEIKDEAVLDISVVMGGVEIKIPEEWHVIMKGFPFMGGFVNHARIPKDEHAKRLIIKGTVIMGGVEVRNTAEPTWDERRRFERERWHHNDIR